MQVFQVNVKHTENVWYYLLMVRIVVAASPLVDTNVSVVNSINGIVKYRTRYANAICRTKPHLIPYQSTNRFRPLCKHDKQCLGRVVHQQKCTRVTGSGGTHYRCTAHQTILVDEILLLLLRLRLRTHTERLSYFVELTFTRLEQCRWCTIL